MRLISPSALQQQDEFLPVLVSGAVGRAAQCALLPPESGFDKASGSTIMLYQVTAFALIGPYSSPNLAPAHLIQCKECFLIGNKIAAGGGEEEL